MGALATWSHEHLKGLVPEHAEFADDGGNRVRIMWKTPSEGRPNRYARPIALHFDTGVAAAVLALPPDVKAAVGNQLRALVGRALDAYPPDAEATEAFIITVSGDILDK
ncbi:hypothetical protein N5J06_20110 [Ralstonia sp. CHL-2022]|uniref:Uncharacterized protein n=1 Tax=Ralstonia mojiangensis TaxID=2953895 RepID=A0ABT2LD11_9RALS|nr:hypothetical protein [Ralstonia mojiangensis]MCT7313285.1 hypothetical protein [Ralstonia mojiangensis]